MGILTEDMKRIVREQRLGFHATVCADGTPNLSPKGTTAVWDDDHLFFAEIRSPQTLANLRRGSKVEINVVDPFVRKGYRFKGTGAIHERGTTEYERGLERLRDESYGTDPSSIGAIVVIHIENARPLVSPAYDRGGDEDSVSLWWDQHFAQLRRGRHRHDPS